MSHDPFSPAAAAKLQTDDADVDAPVEESDPKGEKAPEKPAETPEPEELKVPEGTSKEVMDWVGDDKERAAAALAVEKASKEPRKGLSRDLEELVG